MNKDIFNVIHYPTERIPESAKPTFAGLADTFKIILKDNADILEIGLRGGFILDTLLELPPNDIDLYYRTKPGIERCQCNKMREYIDSKQFPAFQGRKIDLGHLEPGEIELSLGEKTAGIFSHHIDLPSRLFLNHNGDIITCNGTVECIEKRIYEIQLQGWLQHVYFPLSPNPLRNNLYMFTIIQALRGLRMIFTKKYLGCGEEFRKLLMMLPKSLEYCYNSDVFRPEVKRYLTTMIHGMTINDLEWSLTQCKTENKAEILTLFESYKIN
jgi:hypothetical protein